MSQFVARRPVRRVRRRVATVVIIALAASCVREGSGRPQVVTTPEGAVGLIIEGGVQPREARFDSSGRLVVLGEAGRNGGDLFLARFLADGRLDTTFGPGADGTVTFDSEPGHALQEYPSDLEIRGDAILVVGASGGIRNPVEPVRAAGRPTVWPFTAAGRLDTRARPRGTEIHGEVLGSTPYLVRLETRTDGTSLLVDGRSVRRIRTPSNGGPDTFYGVGGRAVTGFESSAVHSVGDVAALPDGRAVVTVSSVGSNPSYLLGLTADGQRDAGFGDGGVVNLGDRNPRGVALDGSGGVVVLTSGGSSSLVERLHRYTASGRLVVERDLFPQARPTGGTFTNPFPESRLTVDRQGRVVLGGFRYLGDWNSNARQAAVMRLTPDLLPDPTFGPGGVVMVNIGDDPGRPDPFSVVDAVAVDAQDHATVAAWNGRDLYVTRAGN